MNVVFADSFFFLALINRFDPAHARATAFSRDSRDTRLTTAWVMTELADGLAKNRAQFRRIYNEVLHNPLFRFVPASQELFDAGIKFYNRHEDKDWPLTDCISFVVMRDNGLTDALTADHHFEQAGFNALLK